MDKYVEKANYTLDVLADLIENKPKNLEKYYIVQDGIASCHER